LMLTSDQLRDAFLRFFEGKGHKIIPSSSLVPADDPTLLLTSAGMVQFKHYFKGEATPPSPRLTSCQKCFRTSDIDSVGDATHLTFFEMLGNFSVGDYFKKEAIAWAWEFVIQHLKLPKERLWITIFQDDDEAFQHWRSIGVPAERILRFGEESNFWGPAGKTGPCGPCSEIHYDFGEAVGCGRPDCRPNCSCGRFSELWNLVFTQYDQDEQGQRKPLPRPNIDTGMGLERTAAALLGKTSAYETDLFLPLLKLMSELSGKSYGQDVATDRALRVVVEHGRGVCFLIADHVGPSSGGRGYVLKHILHRAAIFGRKLGLTEPFLTKLAETVITQMQHVYPELADRSSLILQTIESEEERFERTLEAGTAVLDEIIGWREKLINDFKKQFLQEPLDNLKHIDEKDIDSFISGKWAWDLLLTGEDDVVQRIQKPMEKALQEFKANRTAKNFEEIKAIVESAKTIFGSEVFKLHDTYGFDVELTQEIARDRGLEVDLEGFEAEMKLQRERARASHKFTVTVHDKIVLKDSASVDIIPRSTDFVGYSKLKTESSVVVLLPDGKWPESSVDSMSKCQDLGVILRETPFYGEMGGQVGDTGEIRGKNGTVEVTSTLRDTVANRELIVHMGKVVEGTISVEDIVEAEVDRPRRLNIARNHTATHLLQAALRQVLGKQVRQAGSLVTPDRFRFDFTFLGAPAQEQLLQIQRLVNQKIRENLSVSTRLTDLSKAKEEGVLYLTGEQYGEEVRVIEVGKPIYSAELCGGTHVSATGEIGLFYIVSEGSIGSGIRRIEAVTGEAAESLAEQRLAVLEAIGKELHASPDETQAKVLALLSELERERKRVQALERELARHSVESLLGQVEQVDGVSVLSARVQVSNMPALREMGDLLRDKLKSAVVVLGAVYDDRPNFLALVTSDLVTRGLHAGKIAQKVAAVTGGGGGGRPEMAQAGGKDKSKLEEALRLVKTLVRQK